MSDNSTIQETNTTEETQEKQSTKTFNQSDFDQALARERSKINEKFGDYDTLKSQIETLTQYKKDSELASMSDSDKAQAQINTLNGDLTNAIAQNTDLTKKIVKNDILSRSEFSSLPRAYKSLILADTDEDIVIASANKALEEFKLDTGKENPVTLGAPKIDTVNGQPDIIGNKDQSTLSMRQRFAEKLKSRQ